MDLYSYEGPVMHFDRCVAWNWSATTYAASESKARSNLSYQYKQKNNMVPGARISLPGKITKIQ